MLTGGRTSSLAWTLVLRPRLADFDLAAFALALIGLDDPRPALEAEDPTFYVRSALLHRRVDHPLQ